MSSSDIDMAEIREETRELFDKLMDQLRESFEVKIQEADASSKDIEIYNTLSEQEKYQCTGQSVMCGIASICRVELISWLEDVMEMQNPGSKFHVEVHKFPSDMTGPKE